MHRVVSVAALAAVGAALAGCSAHAGSSPDQQSGGSSGGSGSTPTPSALLTAADLPPGMRISTVDVQQALQQSGGVSKGQPTGGQCQVLAMTGLRPTDVHGVAMAAVQQDTKAASVISESVLTKPSGFDLGAVRSAVKSCGTSTSSMGRTQVTVQTTASSLSGVSADDSVLLHQDIQLQGAPSNVHPTGNDIALIVAGTKLIVLSTSGDTGVQISRLAQQAVQRAGKS